MAKGLPVITKYVKVLFCVMAGINCASFCTKLKAKNNYYSIGNFTEACHASNLFLDKFNFFKRGIVAKASKMTLGCTRVYELENSLLAKLNSSSCSK